ncbi:hypothetical protein B7P43_G17957 [Cryptotermes secundus]|uniref:Mos1 transposase HTH domain-containing protein n=1 Tax=Cryptotermes secundus TaxID=105785 RepID=A0A2J7QR25_9NEOP|nr:hypothetical protein B7P43_G17957 [Cryptotermes secundus]
MASPVAVCTKEEQRTVIRFLWLEGVSGSEIHRRLSTQYGDSALPRGSTNLKVSGHEFRDSIFRGKGAILEDYLEEGCAISSSRYSDLVADNLKPEIRTKRLGFLSRKVLLLLLDITNPHMDGQTVETIYHFGSKVLEHHAYLRKAVHKWLRYHPKTFFLEGIRKHVDRWTKCIERKETM